MRARENMSVLFNAPKSLIDELDWLAVKRKTNRSKLLRFAIRQYLRAPGVVAELTPKPLSRTARVEEVERWLIKTLRKNGNEMLGGEMWRAAVQERMPWGTILPIRRALHLQGRLERPVDAVRNPWRLLW